MSRAARPMESARFKRTDGTGRSPAWRKWAVAATLIALLVLGFAARRALLEATVRLSGIAAWALTALPLFILWTLASALGWRAVISDSGGPRPSLLRLFVIRVQAQSVNLVLPALGLGGDVLRASVLAHANRRASESTASVVLDTTASIVACLLFAGLGTLVGWTAMRCSVALRILAVAGPLGIAAAVCFAPAVLSRIPSWACLYRWQESLHSMALAVGQGYGRGYGRAVVWHVVERLLIVGEIWIYARALGTPLTLLHAVFAAALMTVFSSAMFFVPGQVVVADSGLALGLVWAGASWDVGLAVALARRLRQLLVGLAGALVFLAAVARQGPRD
jgi:hypothetical protein